MIRTTLLGKLDEVVGFHQTKTLGLFLASSLLAIGVVGATSANAAITYYLDVNNIGLSGNWFASVTIAEVGSDIKFTIKTNDSLFDPIQLSNFGIQGFGFNTDLDKQTVAHAIVFPGSYGGGWMADINQNLNGYGVFGVEAFNTGTARQDPLEFTISGIVGDTIDDYTLANVTGKYFAAHITDFTTAIYGWRDSNGDNCTEGDPGCNYVQLTSAFFSHGGATPPTSIVPEPLSAALVGSAMLGLVAIRRKMA